MSTALAKLSVNSSSIKTVIPFAIKLIEHVRWKCGGKKRSFEGRVGRGKVRRWGRRRGGMVEAWRNCQVRCGCALRRWQKQPFALLAFASLYAIATNGFSLTVTYYCRTAHVTGRKRIRFFIFILSSLVAGAAGSQLWKRGNRLGIFLNSVFCDAKDAISSRLTFYSSKQKKKKNSTLALIVPWCNTWVAIMYLKYMGYITISDRENFDSVPRYSIFVCRWKLFFFLKTRILEIRSKRYLFSSRETRTKCVFSVFLIESSTYLTYIIVVMWYIHNVQCKFCLTQS